MRCSIHSIGTITIPLRYNTSETPLVQDDIVVDCGCAEGLFTLVAAPKVKRVIAFEPMPRYLDLLQMTFSGIENVKIVSRALGDQQGTLQFADEGVNSRASVGGNVRVEVNTLDKEFESFAERITFIKADIEGAEIVMLEWAKHIIKSSKPKLALTVYHQENDVKQICRLLLSIHPDYQFRTKGISANVNPLMLHAW